MLSPQGCRALDALLQISIYLALDVVPAACFLISYMAEESFERLGLQARAECNTFVFFADFRQQHRSPVLLAPALSAVE